MKVLIVLASLLAVGLCAMPGGWTKQDPKDAKWWEMLAKVPENQGLLTAEKFDIVDVSSQVVAGANYKLTLKKNGENGGTCEITLWVRVWLPAENQTQVTANTCQDLAKEDPTRELGGVQPVTDFSEPGLQICLGSMLNQINMQSNSYYRLVDSNIISATRQVVSGWMYGFKMEVSPSVCQANAESMGFTSSRCAVNTNSQDGKSIWSGRCWYQDWKDPTTQILDLNRPDIQVDVNLPDNAPPKPDVQVKPGNDLLGADLIDKLPHLTLNRPSKPLEIKVIKATGTKPLVAAKKPLLGGGDNHDYVDHGKKLLGQDQHDMLNHLKQKLLGQDGHDQADHGRKLLGQDYHDMMKHVGNMIGGDGHDYKEHVKKLLGQDGHDMVDHIGKLIGGDGHDYKDHIKKLLGQDGHDLIQHGKDLLGGDDHDLVDHVKKLLGGDKHDYIKHVLREAKANATKKQNLGGDGHDLCHMGMFKLYQKKYQKQYQLGEEEKRFAVFCDNMKKARKLQETDKGSAIYGATKFADLTEEEFKQYVGKPWDQTANKGMKKADIPKGPVPDAYDWREHGAVTPVKNQGSCGSCWAFSTTGNIEGQWLIKKGKLVSLSEQELVDCDKVDDGCNGGLPSNAYKEIERLVNSLIKFCDKVDDGCNGGLPSNAYKEIERLGGLETEAEYKYVGEDEKCAFKKSDVRVFINDSVSISQNETDMAAWLAKNGPISIGINAFAMQFYMGGISHPWSFFCNPTKLDHGVLIVGYGVQDSEPYWIVKNSWGPDWGEKGYYLVYRGSGVCGLNTMCTSAIVD